MKLIHSFFAEVTNMVTDMWADGFFGRFTLLMVAVALMMCLPYSIYAEIVVQRAG